MQTRSCLCARQQQSYSSYHSYQRLSRQISFALFSQTKPESSFSTARPGASLTQPSEASLTLWNVSPSRRNCGRCFRSEIDGVENGERAVKLPQSPYGGTSLIRKRPPLGLYRRPMVRVLGGSYGGGRFLMSKVPLYFQNPMRPVSVNYSRGLQSTNTVKLLLRVTCIAFSFHRERAPCLSQLYLVPSVSRCQTEVHADRPILR